MCYNGRHNQTKEQTIMENNKKIVEIDGIKLEIDMRTAKRIDQFKVGDKVKILVKKYDTYEPHHGVIIGFEAFKVMPTIIVAYLECKYSEADIKFAYINSSTSKDYEILHCEDEVRFEKESVIEKLDRKIEASIEQTNDLKSKKQYFLTHFNEHFSEGQKK
jgi:hypothetical protein